MRDRILRELRTSYEQQQAANRLEEDRRRAEATARCPGLSEALDARQALIFDTMRGILGGKAAAADLPARMEESNREVARLLTAGGYPADHLDPVYRCPVCRDTGYVGEPVREMCTCLRRAFYARLYHEIGLDAEADRFDRFDETVFDDSRPLPEYGGQTQRKAMQVLRRLCERYADSYPQADTADLLLMGKSGLGKTFLMHCIAGRLLERGFNVLMVSSYRFQEAARKAIFSGQSEELDSLMGTDILLLDDLGSEALIPNVTVEQLFNLINERQRTGKALIISTNLNEKELRARYTERVASRLLAPRQCRSLLFFGEDVRRSLQGGDRR